MSFRDRVAVHPGRDLELPEVAHLGQLLGPQRDFLLRPDGGEKFHAPNGGEKKERPLLICKTGGGRDPGGLRQRLGQDDARDERVARKMPGKHRIVAREKGGAFRQLPGVAAEQLPNENKGRPMGKMEEVISDM